MQVQAIGREFSDGTISVGNPPRKYESREHFLEDYADDVNLDEFELAFDEVILPDSGRLFQVLIDA